MTDGSRARQDEAEGRHHKGITAFLFLAGDGEKRGVNFNAKILSQKERIFCVVPRKIDV